jgi:hypothetical protein
MNPKHLSAIAVAVIGLILATQWRLPAENTDNANASTVHQFGPGTLVVQNTESQQPSLMKNARLEKIGDRYFVHGTGHNLKRVADDDRYTWYDGTDVSVAWSSVYSYYLLTGDQEEKYEKAFDAENN